MLQADFTFVNVAAGNDVHYCYLYKDGSEAPTLRVHPGDWLILSLTNRLRDLSAAHSRQPAQGVKAPRMQLMPMPSGSCGGGMMDGFATNLHFHGLTVPPLCHQDDVLRTLIPSGGVFGYRFRIPADEPPGVYWYHPHVHGFSNVQVQGGASGALIVEGIERANSALAGLPERVLIVRDQPLLNPDAPPSKSESVPNLPVLRDAEGDILNMGTGTGKPSRDLSLNFVPVPYPDYPPAVISTRPSERQLWRLLNAAAITYVDLQILVGGVPQPLGLVSLDGVPINENGKAPNRILWQANLIVPPGGRVDFIYKTPPEGVRASLVTRAVDTGPAGENDPVRPLASIVPRAGAPEPRSALPTDPVAAPPSASAWLGDVQPVRQRKLYFSERPSDPSDPNSPTQFFITVEGQQPAVYDPRSTEPNITVQQGDVEDWTIENRSRELHTFHIHQIHFLLVGWNGVPINDTFLRDSVNVLYWDGTSASYPSVKIRVDFRDPNTVGTFVYHCHLLEHEDRGMMGTIEVKPNAALVSSRLRK